MENKTTVLLYVPEFGKVTSSHTQLVMDYKLCSRSLQFITYNKNSGLLDKIEVDLNGGYEISELDFRSRYVMHRYDTIQCNFNDIPLNACNLRDMFRNLNNVDNFSLPMCQDPGYCPSGLYTLYNTARTVNDFIDTTLRNVLSSIRWSVHTRQHRNVILIVNEDLIANKVVRYILRTYGYFFNRCYAGLKTRLTYLSLVNPIDESESNHLVFDWTDASYDLNNTERLHLEPYKLELTCDKSYDDCLFCDLTGNNLIVDKLRTQGCQTCTCVSNALKNVLYPDAPDVSELFRGSYECQDPRYSFGTVIDDRPISEDVILQIDNYIDRHMDLGPSYVMEEVFCMLLLEYYVRSDHTTQYGPDGEVDDAG